MEEMPVTEFPENDFMLKSSRALTYSIWGNALSFSFFIPVLGIITSIAGLILSIIGITRGRKGMEKYKTDKRKYNKGSFVKTLIAFILGIVGTVQAGILIIYAVILTILILSESRIF